MNETEIGPTVLLLAHVVDAVKKETGADICRLFPLANRTLGY